MAYWWVSQKWNYRQQRTGGFLWARNSTDAGRTPFHWAAINEVRPVDLILSHVRGKVVSVAVAKTAAFDSPRPDDQGDGSGRDAGKMVEVERQAGLGVAGEPEPDIGAIRSSTG